jgi:hypothetical protein
MYTVLKINKENSSKVDALYQDDLVSRQTIIRRDNVSLGLKDEALYVIIDGSQEAIDRAVVISKDFATVLSASERENVYKKVKEQDESTLEGIGSIFG